MMKSLLKKLTLYEWRNRDLGAPNRRPQHFPSAFAPMKPPPGWTWPSAKAANGKKAKPGGPGGRPAAGRPEVVIRHYVEHDPARPERPQPELVIRHYVERDPGRPAAKYRRNRPGRRSRSAGPG